MHALDHCRDSPPNALFPELNVPLRFDSLALRSFNHIVLGGQVMGRLLGRTRQLGLYSPMLIAIDVDGLAAAPPTNTAARSSSCGSTSSCGCCLFEMQAERIVFWSSDPVYAAGMAAPPVRSLEGALGQYLDALAPLLAASRLSQLSLTATYVSTYQVGAGTLGILSTTSLPPAGEVQPAAVVDGYHGRLAWPAPRPATAPTHDPYFCLTIRKACE